MEGKGVLFKRFADIDVFDIEIDEHEHRRDRPHLPADRADLRRHQPRRHPRARVLRDREAADREPRHPGLPRRPARHRDHLRRGAAQRAPDHGQQDRRTCAWCSRAPARPASPARGSTRTSAFRPRTSCSATRKGVIYEGRTDGMNAHKLEFARETKARTLADALRGADVFVGLSQAGAMSADMVRAMAPKPIIFAMANPDPGDHAARGGSGAPATRSWPPAAPTIRTR